MKNSLDVEGTWEGPVILFHPVCGTHDYAYIHIYIYTEVVQVKMEKRAMDAEQETCTMWSPTADHMTKCSYSDVFHRFFTVGNPIQLLHVIFFSGTIISIMPQAS